MRGLILLAGIGPALALAIAYPYVGVLLWSWFTLQQPHQEAYGFVQTAPLNSVIAIVTLAAWTFAKKRRLPQNDFLFWLVIGFLSWMTFNSFFAFDPSWSWTYWNLIWKTFLLGLVIAATATSRTRIYALVWVIVISLFYYGIKGGMFTLITGGRFHVVGPPSTIIADNNQLALALLMVLPFANYLRGQVADKRLAFLLMIGITLTVIAVVGSYSRGALIGLAALSLFMLVRVRRRLIYLAIALVVLTFVVNFMPEHFFNRADTISNFAQDESFQGRLYAWRVAFLYASDHFPFVAGFYAPQLPGIFHFYFPDQIPHAAHSIYFQVLGEHGFVGIAIYLSILTAAFLRCSRILKASRRTSEHQWAYDLAIAIQASLFVFCVAGAALSMAYYDLFIIEVAILLPLGQIVLAKEKLKQDAWRPAHAGPRQQN